jgi:putative DNA primase/helicase
MQEIKKPLSSAKDQRLQNDSLTIDHNNKFKKNTQEESWSIPVKLVPDIPRTKFPINYFPESMQNAINEVFNYVKAPIELISTSALTALSICGQGLALVSRDSALVGPISLYTLVIAESGERKTTCDNFFIKPIREHQAQSELEIKKEKDFYSTLIKKHEKQKKALVQELEKLPIDSSEQFRLKNELKLLYDSKPAEPVFKKLIYADTTPEALAWSLYNKWKAAAIITAEAGEFFGSTGMRSESLTTSLSILNNLWDGSEVHVDRKMSEMLG